MASADNTADLLAQVLTVNECPGAHARLFEDLQSEVPASVLLRGRGEKIARARKLREEGKDDEAAALEATIPSPNDLPKVVQRERRLIWENVPPCLASKTPQMIPFPSWEPGFRANMEDVGQLLPEYMVRMLMLPHPVPTGGLFIMMHSDRPPRPAAPMSVVRDAWEVVRVWRAVVEYYRCSDPEVTTWRNLVDQVHKTMSDALAQHCKTFGLRVRLDERFAAFKKRLEDTSYVSPAVLDDEVRQLAEIYGEMSREYAVGCIRTLEAGIVALTRIDLAEAIKHDLLTPKAAPDPRDFDKLFLEHLYEEQIKLAEFITSNRMRVNNVRLEAIKRFPHTYRGALSHWLLFWYLEWTLLPSGHPLLGEQRV